MTISYNLNVTGSKDLHESRDACANVDFY